MRKGAPSGAFSYNVRMALDSEEPPRGGAAVYIVFQNR